MAGTIPIVESVRGSSPTPLTETQTSVAATDSTANMSLHERSYIQCMCAIKSSALERIKFIIVADQVADCRNELRSLIRRQQDHYIEALRLVCLACF